MRTEILALVEKFTADLLQIISPSKPRGLAAVPPERRSEIALKAARTRRLRASALKAVATRRANAAAAAAR